MSLTRAAIDDASALTSVGIYAVNAETTEQTYGIRPAGIYGKYKPATANGITSLVPENVPTDQTIWLNNEKAIIFSCHPAPANGNNDIKNDPVTGSTSSTDPVPTVPVPVVAIEYTSSKTATTNQVDLTQPENDYMYGVEYKNNTYQGKPTLRQQRKQYAERNQRPRPVSQHRSETCFCQTSPYYKKKKTVTKEPPQSPL
ncbi:MAG: hypothetical protein ACLVEJ_14515 [Parabacteroides sp.]